MGDELLRSTGGEIAADETGGTQTKDFTAGENVPVQAESGTKEGRSTKKPKAVKDKPHKEKKPKAVKRKKKSAGKKKRPRRQSARDCT